MFRKILIPIADDHDPNSGRAVELAQALCDEGGDITALTVVEAGLTGAPMQARMEEVEAALKADLGGVRGVRPVVVTGHSARTILEYAEEHDVDLIIMSSHRPGLSDYFLGSTAARVVRHANCAVHVIR